MSVVGNGNEGVVMIKIYSLVTLAGLCAGAWPLVMKPANFGGGAIAVSYCIFSLVAALALLAREGLRVGAEVDMPVVWQWAAVASTLAAVALLFFSIVIPQVPREKLGAVYAVLMLVQISVPVLYHMALQLYEHHTVDLKHLAGAVAALIAAYLLT